MLGNVIEMLASIIETLASVIRRNVKTTSDYHNPHLLLYKPVEHFPSSLCRFLECRKCNILVITQALIYVYLPLGFVCISGKALLPVL